MTIEEKAKAYDEAKINGSRLWECGEITRENYEYMFPEIEESEDEKIRKTQENVEYTRTDILIEKTLKWIDATFHGTSIDGYGGESVDVVMSDASVYKNDLFESFKNYIKGE